MARAYLSLIGFLKGQAEERDVEAARESEERGNMAGEEGFTARF